MDEEKAFAPSQQLAQDVEALFIAIENKYPHESLGTETWYLVTIAALVVVDPDQLGTLYTYLINKAKYQSSDSRKALIKRIREALVKLISLIGVCKPLEAIMVIAKLERPEDRDFSFSRENWKSGTENRKRGEDWLNVIYRENLNSATSKFEAHRDFDFISREITYGLYLSDHNILGPVETELVVLSGILIQNLPIESAWHLRGARRVGMSSEDVELVQQCVELVAQFGGLNLNRVPRVAAIEHEV